MSINDPHLEAQMRLEESHPDARPPEPDRFTRQIAWVIVGVGAVAILAWLVTVLQH